ncbi:MAG: CsgG/HfaB family protein [Elusimicrobia bacterium]|nr:CsgG/HfaB family protein [Elusimicrobiota bacterium]
MINIAVAEFTGKNVSQADASIVADFLRTELVNTGLYKVMDRNNMDTVLAEQKFQSSGCTEQQCAVEMGKLLNVKKMLVGSLSKLLDTYYITVNVVDVETGEITASYDSNASSSLELRDACRKIVEKLSRKQ